jgi:hypothetical protein
LKPKTRDWLNTVIAGYDLEEHHVRLLTLAFESWDRCVQAREAIADPVLPLPTDLVFQERGRKYAVERDAKI